MRELCERTVEADGLVRVVVHGGLDHEDPDEAEHDAPRKVANRPDPGDPLADGRAHLTGLRVIEEVLADAAVCLVKRAAAEHETREADDPGATRPTEHARRRLLGAAGAAAARAEQ